MSRSLAPSPVPVLQTAQRLRPRIGRWVIGASVVALSSTAMATVVAAPADAATRTVYSTSYRAPSADSTTSSTTPGSRHGYSKQLTVGTTWHNTRRTYLRFSAPTTGSITSAKLTLTRSGRWSPGTLRAYYGGTWRWSERVLSARNAPHTHYRVAAAYVSRHRHTVTLDLTRLFRAHRQATVVLMESRHHLTQFASGEARHGKPTLRIVTSRRVYYQQPVTAHPTPPVTSPPVTKPPSPPVSIPPVTKPPSNCAISAKLVPNCGKLWGVAPMGFAPMALKDSVPQEEAIAQRQMDIVHTYHVNDQLFPTADERAEAEQPGHSRLLLINWKPATDMSWAAVAAGKADARIDKEAAYIRSTFDHPFYLAIFHEPENDVQPAAGSGWTAVDYAAMYRHTVLRLRADGVTNAVTVMNYMGFDKWAEQSWFKQLWPGDDVVDWIGLDPYGTGAATGYNAHDYATLVNRPELGFPGYYSWATSTHPGKPIMLCEWGISYDASNPTGQAAVFKTVSAQLNSYPQIKALVYYDVPKPPNSSIPLTTVTLNSSAEAAFRSLAGGTTLAAPRWSY